jgi:hypothetical protein
MGFETAFEEATDKSRSSSTSSSSSSSGSSRSTTKGLSLPSGTNPDDFPVFSIASPYAVIRETDDGYEFEANTVTAVEMKKTWYSAPWEYADHKPGEWKKVWWRQSAFRHTAHVVDDVTGEDLRTLLSEDVSRALDIIHEASNKYDRDGSEWSPYRTCQVCGEDLHVRYDQIEEVNKRPVCSDHTIQEVASSGIMQD